MIQINGQVFGQSIAYRLAQRAQCIVSGRHKIISRNSIAYGKKKDDEDKKKKKNKQVDILADSLNSIEDEGLRQVLIKITKEQDRVRSQVTKIGKNTVKQNRKMMENQNMGQVPGDTNTEGQGAGSQAVNEDQIYNLFAQYSSMIDLHKQVTTTLLASIESRQTQLDKQQSQLLSIQSDLIAYLSSTTTPAKPTTPTLEPSEQAPKQTPSSPPPATESPDPDFSHLEADFDAAVAAVNNTDVLESLQDIYTQTSSQLSPSTESQSQSLPSTQHPSPTTSDSDQAPPLSGVPPTLAEGAGYEENDLEIRWVNQLQAALERKGFCCPEEEADDCVWGSGTTSALLTFQACEGLPETGIADEATWTALLGPDFSPITADDSASESSGEGAGSPAWESSSEGGTMEASSNGGSAYGGAVDKGQWPVLREDDNGQMVHALQALLFKQGFYSGDDDMTYWQFGSATSVAVTSAQAMYGLAETGVVDGQLWSKLMGEGASVEDLQSVRSNDSYDEDCVQDGVYLIGEQRWERRE